MAGFYHGICDLNLLFGSNHTRDWYMEQWGAGTMQFSLEPDPVFTIETEIEYGKIDWQGEMPVSSAVGAGCGVIVNELAQVWKKEETEARAMVS